MSGGGLASLLCGVPPGYDIVPSVVVRPVRVSTLSSVCELKNTAYCVTILQNMQTVGKIVCVGCVACGGVACGAARGWEGELQEASEQGGVSAAEGIRRDGGDESLVRGETEQKLRPSSTARRATTDLSLAF